MISDNWEEPRSEKRRRNAMQDQAREKIKIKVVTGDTYRIFNQVYL